MKKLGMRMSVKDREVVGEETEGRLSFLFLPFPFGDVEEGAAVERVYPRVLDGAFSLLRLSATE